MSVSCFFLFAQRRSDSFPAHRWVYFENPTDGASSFRTKLNIVAGFQLYYLCIIRFVLSVFVSFEVKKFDCRFIGGMLVIEV